MMSNVNMCDRSVAEIERDLRRVSANFEPKRQELVDRALQRINEIIASVMAGVEALPSDPVVIAVEAAVCGVEDRSKSPLESAQAALTLLPQNSTDFMRGMTFGMAALLALGSRD